jgi:hypothetical protein
MASVGRTGGAHPMIRRRRSEWSNWSVSIASRDDEFKIAIRVRIVYIRGRLHDEYSI